MKQKLMEQGLHREQENSHIESPDRTPDEIRIKPEV